MLVVCQFRYTRTRVQKSAFSTNALKEMRSEVQRTEHAERTNERTSRDAEQLSLNLQPDTEAATHVVRHRQAQPCTQGKHNCTCVSQLHRSSSVMYFFFNFCHYEPLCKISMGVRIFMHVYLSYTYPCTENVYRSIQTEEGRRTDRWSSQAVACLGGWLIDKCEIEIYITFGIMKKN